MNCQQVLDILECRPPGGEPPAGEEFAAAAAHLDDCPDCHLEYEARQLFDQRVVARMQDVAIPAGLRSRLLDAVAEADDASAAGDGDVSPMPAAADSVTTPPANSVPVARRRWLWSVAGSVAGLVLGIAGWQWFVSSGQSVIALHELQTSEEVLAAADQWDMLPVFSGSFDAVPPSNFEIGRITISEARELRTRETGGRPIAMFEFTLRGGRRGTASGVLLALPADWLKTPPTATSLGAAASDPRYLGSHATVAWNERGRAYVCFVNNGAEGLELLLDIMRGSPA